MSDVVRYVWVNVENGAVLTVEENLYNHSGIFDSEEEAMEWLREDFMPRFNPDLDDWSHLELRELWHPDSQINGEDARKEASN